LSDKIGLTKKQIEFIIYMTEIEDPSSAVEEFMTIMVEERAEPAQIEKYVDKMIKKLEFKS
jgi:hypothetical protein